MLTCVITPLLAGAQPFGRFGYQTTPKIAGFNFAEDSFATKHPSSDRIRFAKPLGAMKVLQTTDTMQVFGFEGGPGLPSKLRINLLSPGFELFFADGMALKLFTTSSPYLSWKEGSVTNGVPTPESDWSLLSFRDNQPPLVFGFVGQKASLEIAGTAGDWTVQTSPKFIGWVRVALPIGLEGRAANTAGALGQIAQQTAKYASVWSRSTPQLVKTDMTSDATGIDVTWTYSDANIVLPQPITLAELGGYPLKVLSRHHPAEWSDEEGPVELSDEPTLKVHFPVKAFPLGRAIGVGKVTSEPLASASYADIASVCELAFENLVGNRDVVTAKACEATLTEFLAESEYVKESNTGQLLPYAPDGNGLDLAASHSLLMQANLNSDGRAEANSLLTSILLRMDAYSWTFAGLDLSLSRRASALAAVAGALSTDQEHRLQAGKLMAGLAGQKGLSLWRRRQSQAASSETLSEPLYGIRHTIFSLSTVRSADADFGELLLSPLRILSKEDVTLVAEPKLSLQWSVIDAKSSVMRLWMSQEATMEMVTNLRRFEFKYAPEEATIVYAPVSAGLCVASLGWTGKSLPKNVTIPPFSEKAP